jgi:ring-1,2-phenylacetyl-CoA epoxidase subunit PaaD
MTQVGRDALREYGIAPPLPRPSHRARFAPEAPVPCPRCASTATEKISEFGSTACKALWRCTACREPFDYFKCL